MASDAADAPGKQASDMLPSLIAISITFIVLDTIFVGLRTFCRLAIQRVSFGVDDLLIFPAYVLNVALCAIGILMAKIEIKYAGDLPADHVLSNDPSLYYSMTMPVLKCIYALLPLLYFGAVFPKLSLLFLYLRIFVDRYVRIATKITMGFVVTIGITFTIVALFACHPVNYFWNRMIPGGTCISSDNFYRINTPFHAVLDIVIFVIPMPALWKLQAPHSKKIGLTIVFALAACGIIACVGRWITVLKYTSEVIAANTTTLIVGWCIIEPAMYLIAACLPPCSSLIMLFVRDDRIRRMVTRATRTTQTGNTTGRKSVLGGLSSKPTSGFGRLSDSGSQYHGEPRGFHSKEPSMNVHEPGSSTSDVPMKDLEVGVRTDITIEESRQQRKPSNEATLSEMLRQGYS